MKYQKDKLLKKILNFAFILKCKTVCRCHWKYNENISYYLRHLKHTETVMIVIKNILQNQEQDKLGTSQVRMQVQSLVRELRFPMPPCMANICFKKLIYRKFTPLRFPMCLASQWLKPLLPLSVTLWAFPDRPSPYPLL